MSNYGHGYARPVKDGNKPTKVYLRCLLGELIEMNTKEQILKINVYLKMTWTDEFLVWNPDDWGNITSIHIPDDVIWFPDLTLYSSVSEDRMIAIPTNMYAIVFADGSVTWFAPAIITTFCKQRVKYFPFDTQVCLLRFASWSADADQIDFYPEQGIDATQNRFLADGTWELVNVSISRVLIEYNCCPEAYAEIFHYVMFKRRPEFYISYIIVPCTLISFLALLVFYLPAECGEKLTLSTTNLLGLVVFQQLVSATMPPSAEASPILGTYFTILICLVCLSVFITVVVLHIGVNTCPMPPWAEWFFIDFLGKCVFLTKSDSKVKPADTSTVIKQENGYYDTSFESAVHRVEQQQIYTIPNKVNSPNNNDCPATQIIDTEGNVNYLAKILSYLENYRQEEKLSQDNSYKWRLAATILDRCIFYFVAVFTSVTTVAILREIYYGADEDFNSQVREMFGDG